MKKVFLTALMCLGLGAAAQSNKFLSVHYGFGEPSQIGISFEQKKEGSDKSYIANLSYGTMQYDTPFDDITGSGVVIEIGSRYYENDKSMGLYGGNYLSYGNIKFDDDFALYNFEGNYSYFSFFQPEIGYKFQIGNNFYIDPYIGTIWKIEIKGKGDVDNKNVDEWALRAGVRLTFGL